MKNLWVYEIPKVELHCHLDGSLSLDTVRTLALMSGVLVPSKDSELRELLQVGKDCKSLVEYLEKFSLPLACLQTKETLEYAAYSLMKDAMKENVMYMEVRFAPRSCTRGGLSCKEVVQSVLKGLNRGREEFGVENGLIICGMRHEKPEVNIAMLEEIKEYINNGVCGIDLAGSEADYPPLLHKPYFDKAKELEASITIHAGECGSAEHVQTAIALGAKRIGHGIALMNNHEILLEVKDKGIGLEMCPTSNFDTKAVSDRKDYPLRMFLEEGLMVTLNTDNRTVSNTNMSYEFLTAVQEFCVTKEEAVTITQNAIMLAFISEEKRKLLLKKLNQFVN